MSNDRKPKKSWRDIDKGKDGSAHRRVERPGSDPYSRKTNKSYRAELDQFFDKGVVSNRIQGVIKESGNGPEKPNESNQAKIKLIRKVRQAETFDGFVNAVNELRTTFGLPNDADVLTRVLEHPDNSAVVEALDALCGMSKRLKLIDIKAISARLDTLEAVSDDSAVLKSVEALRAKM